MTHDFAAVEFQSFILTSKRLIVVNGVGTLAVDDNNLFTVILQGLYLTYMLHYPA